MSHIRVGVMRGGPSSEYEMSLDTGKSVLQELSTHPDYTPIDIFIDKAGNWHAQGAPLDPGDLNIHVDVVFNAMHGEYGEDGQVQQILDSLKIPYTGSGVFSSALAMHKGRAKQEFKREGIPTAPSATFSIESDDPDTLREIFRTLAGPYIVKPLSGGASGDVRTANSFAGLHEAAYDVGAMFRDVLIEKMIRGREAACGVIDDFRGDRHYALLPIEVTPTSESSRFSREETATIQEYARRAHMLLGMRDYSRSDFIVTPRGVYILGTSSLPALASGSHLPQSLRAVGSSVIEFLHHTISRAHARR